MWYFHFSFSTSLSIYLYFYISETFPPPLRTGLFTVVGTGGRQQRCSTAVVKGLFAKLSIVKLVKYVESAHYTRYSQKWRMVLSPPTQDYTWAEQGCTGTWAGLPSVLGWRLVRINFLWSPPGSKESKSAFLQSNSSCSNLLLRFIREELTGISHQSYYTI